MGQEQAAEDSHPELKHESELTLSTGISTYPPLRNKHSTVVRTRKPISFLSTLFYLFVVSMPLHVCTMAPRCPLESRVQLCGGVSSHTFM